MASIPVSAVIITFNEEHNLERCLQSLTGVVDDIIIVDSFSTDATPNIAKKMGAKISYQTFSGFGTQKQKAVDLAQNEWVLSIDADEILSTELCQELLHLNLEQSTHAGYTIPRQHLFMNHVFQYGKESRIPILRLFNKNKGGFSAHTVHEKIELQGTIGHLKHKLLHDSYLNLEHYLRKMNSYTSYSALELYKSGARKSLPIMLLSIPFNFTKHYFLDGNLWNGRAGFIWSILSTLHQFIKYLKLSELHQNKKL